MKPKGCFIWESAQNEVLQSQEACQGSGQTDGYQWGGGVGPLVSHSPERKDAGAQWERTAEGVAWVQR